MPLFGRKKKEKSNSIYLSLTQFKKLAHERNITKDDRFLTNYFKDLATEKGVKQDDAEHAINCIVINAANDKTLNSKDNIIITNMNGLSGVVDIQNTLILKHFILHCKDKNEIKLAFTKSCANKKYLDSSSIGLFLYELITHFLRYKCLQKKLSPYSEIADFIDYIHSQLSYFNDNRDVFSFSLLAQYLPLILTKYNRDKKDIKSHSQQVEMNELMLRMTHISNNINDYQHDMEDIMENLKLRSIKLRSNTYPEQMEELKDLCYELKNSIDILSDDLIKVENDQLSAERFAEDLRNKTLQKFGLLDINLNIKNVINNNDNEHEQTINNIILSNHNRNKSQSKSQSQSQSQSQSHTIDSATASTSIRKPFFVRPLGFNVEFDSNSNELFVSNVILNSQAYKLKVCRGWKIVMVGREDRINIMHQILNEANKQTNDIDDDNALPLFITFQIGSLQHIH